jgi:hypothetical protein
MRGGRAVWGWGGRSTWIDGGSYGHFDRNLEV